MSFKKHNPGCPCEECTPTLCEDRCLYKCTGSPCPDPCAIKINMPTPDSIEQASGPSCPPAGCTITAPCNACLKFFDRVFPRKWIPPFGSSVTQSGDCEQYEILFQPFSGSPAEPCWTSTNYDCPYDSEAVSQCQSLYTIKDPQVKWVIDQSGECSKTIVTIKYTVVKECNAVAILEPPYAISPETTYEHVFEKTHCNCEDVLGEIPYASTTTTNNAAGITLPDPCNAEAATVELIDYCPWCTCFECNDFSGEILLSVDGPGFTGTITLTNPTAYQSIDSCVFVGEFPVECEQGISKLFAVVRVYCFDCELYQLELYVSPYPESDPSLIRGTIDSIACGESGTFTNTGPYDFCDVDEYTFSVPSL